MVISETLVGGLIGRNGSNISRIRNESGAVIKVYGGKVSKSIDKFSFVVVLNRWHSQSRGLMSTYILSWYNNLALNSQFYSEDEAGNTDLIHQLLQSPPTESVHVVLLESRDRLGGRVCTDYSFGFPIDLGASWLHGVCKENPLAPLIGKLGLPLVPYE
ncbi:hypothetical protein ACFXTI_014445 [Malus domestica]